jgi:hypothetical protein
VPRFGSFAITGSPPPWTVTTVDKFIVGALNRVVATGGDLPPGFHLSLCPWGERNALGGTPAEVQEILDPRLRLVHFTGCGRPYLVLAFIGDDAPARQEIAMRHLPWSEHFRVDHEEGHATLTCLEATEDLWNEDETGVVPGRTLQDLLRRGELVDF